MRSSIFRSTATATSLFVALALAVGLPTTGTAATTVTPVAVDGTAMGERLDGIGAASAGASSRLLIDYPEPQRSEVLDYLFKPGYGASLQLLKLELGSGANSTDGTEPDHEPVQGQVDCGVGYEFWLAKEAKARNPEIKLAGLAWGAPGWVDPVSANGQNFWTSRTIDWEMSWLDCATANGLHIDYMGGWNENEGDAAWFVDFRARLDAAGHQDVQLVADDDLGWGPTISKMQANPAFRDAVGVMGEHYRCGWMSTSESCSGPAERFGKPAWNSEGGSQDYTGGATHLAKEINRGYTDGRITGFMNWSPVWSAYQGARFAGSGLMVANTPWSGHYSVGKSVWVTAHTTQFTKVGWRYLPDASKRIQGGSLVTLRDPGTANWSSVIETSQATVPETLNFTVSGGLPANGVLRVRSTDLNSNDPAQWFTTEPNVQVVNGQATFTTQPGKLYTLSTLTTSTKGAAVPPANSGMSLPYTDGFDSYAPRRTPKYYADLGGTLETAQCGGGRSGMCLRATMTDDPVYWNKTNRWPRGVIGDPGWRNYTAATDVNFETNGLEVWLGVRDTDLSTKGNYDATPDSLPTSFTFDNPDGIRLAVNQRGSWQIRTASRTVLAQGSRPAFALNSWHRLSITALGSTITASIDGVPLGAPVTAPAGTATAGQVSLGVSSYNPVQFDNLTVQPGTGVIGAAESTDTDVAYAPWNAIDGNTSTIWHSRWRPAAVRGPHDITLQLGGIQPVSGVGYLPRQDQGNARITRYAVSTSTDGVTFTQVATGTWANDGTLKSATFPAGPAKFVRLTSLVDGYGGVSAAAEITIQ
ncbi:discoidin domain-containing protein [Streptomyces sp. BE20]|uniref:discoidin domain-containing protein n=1 Tax=Streptomyces sp. BE20 TaxID=3002525 RepID=UPI002E78CE98|nr:discoidin domain-containing protein [Streptomyces sp. BE20]MEE1820904.1 discoidin domain-containing protein [Streptomyces sp. BE20]